MVSQQKVHKSQVPPTAPNIQSARYQKRITHLIKCGAFRKRNLGTKLGSHTLRNYVSDRLRNYITRTAGSTVITRKTSYKALKNQSRTCGKKTSKRYEHRRAEDGLTPVPASDTPVEIKDDKGIVVAYRFRLPMDLIENLEQTSQLLPVVKGGKHKRGDYSLRHYAVWADRQNFAYLSSDYKREKKEADQWFTSNARLFDHLSEVLRLHSPEMFVSMTNSIHNATDGKLSALAGAWHGVAIGQGIQSDGGKNHQDWNDQKPIFNALVPFGADGWEGGDIALWQLGLRVQVQRGDCFMFMGAIIAHRSFPVTIGCRNFIDLFCHKSVWDVAKKELEKKGVQRPVKERTVRQEQIFQEQRKRVSRNKRCKPENRVRNKKKQRVSARRVED